MAHCGIFEKSTSDDETMELEGKKVRTRIGSKYVDTGPSFMIESMLQEVATTVCSKSEEVNLRLRILSTGQPWQVALGRSGQLLGALEFVCAQR
jgi:hypothetical protein